MTSDKSNSAKRHETLEEQIRLCRVGSHCYEVDSHEDWAMGPVLHGGHIAAVIHAVAAEHLTTTLSHVRQPDPHTLHFEFLRFCKSARMRIVVTDLKTGKGSSLLQLLLSQDGEVKTLALVTATNFDISLGPSVDVDWTAQLKGLPAGLVPDFEKIERQEREENWILSHPDGSFFRTISRMQYLYPRAGFPIDGIVCSWEGFRHGERMGAVHLTFLGDCVPSMSDTLLHNDGMYDAHRTYREKLAWSEKHPGKPTPLYYNPIEATKAEVWNTTLTMDVEFKAKPPKEGHRWAFFRLASKMLKGGRLDLNLTVCDEQMAPIMLAKQVVLCSANRRRYTNSEGKEEDDRNSKL